MYMYICNSHLFMVQSNLINWFSTSTASLPNITDRCIRTKVKTASAMYIIINTSCRMFRVFLDFSFGESMFVTRMRNVSNPVQTTIKLLIHQGSSDLKLVDALRTLQSFCILNWNCSEKWWNVFRFVEKVMGGSQRRCDQLVNLP